MRACPPTPCVMGWRQPPATRRWSSRSRTSRFKSGAHLDTYDTTEEAEADRARHQKLLGGARRQERALRRDECGAWRITGSRGSIHTQADGKTYVHWTYTKRRLDFCAVS